MPDLAATELRVRPREVATHSGGSSGRPGVTLPHPPTRDSPARYGRLMDHHADAFFVASDRCFRLVNGTGGKKGQPHHCRAPVEWRGRYVTPSGKAHGVWACDGHSDGLKARRPT